MSVKWPPEAAVLGAALCFLFTGTCGSLREPHFDATVILLVYTAHTDLLAAVALSSI